MARRLAKNPIALGIIILSSTNMFKIFKRIKCCLVLFVNSLALLMSHNVFAGGGSNPFPSIGGAVTGDVVKTVGTHMQAMFKYALMGAGGLLIAICIGVLVHRIREDNREKDHGNLIMTFVVLALGLTIGFVLIGIGWTAFSTDIQS